MPWWRRTDRRSLEEGDKLGKIFSAPELTRDSAGGTVNALQFDDVFVGGPPDYDLTGDFTIPSGKTLHVENRMDLRGVDLTVQGTLALSGTLDLSNVGGTPSWVFVQGPNGVLEGVDGTGAEITCDDGAELVADGGLIDTSFITVGMNCPNACMVAENGGTIRFDSATQTFTNGSFLANLGGVVEVPQNGVLRFESSAGDHRIEAGAQFKMGKDADLVFYSPVDMEGTPAAPVRIERLDPAQAWDNVSLLADGNTLEHVLIDGGYKNLSIASDQNVLRYVTSRNGWRNLSTQSDYTGGGRSHFTAYKSLFEDATSVGVVLYNTDVTSFTYSIVRDNAQAGLWLSNASLSPFAQNEVYGNGAVSTSRDGIEVLSSSYLFMGDEVKNIIRDNGGDAVYVSGSGQAALGKKSCRSPEYCFSYGGYNTLDDGPTAIVRNASSYPVNAEGNYWGTSSPQSYWTSGSVDTSPYRTTPVSGAGAGSGVGAVTHAALSGLIAQTAGDYNGRSERSRPVC